MKKLSFLLMVAAVLLSDVMCAVVAYAYRDMLCGIAHSCYSAPASVAFLYAIPFGIGIILCTAAAYILYRRASRYQDGRLRRLRTVSAASAITRMAASRPMTSRGVI